MKKKILYFILVISLLCNSFLLLCNKFQKIHLKETNAKYDKFKKYYQILNCWIASENRNATSIEKYFIQNGYKKIAIYGMGEIGTRLFEKLKGSEVKVCYFLDEKADDTNFEIDTIQVHSTEDISILEKVDAVIITPIHQYEEIVKKLLTIEKCITTVSIEEIFR